MKVNAKMATGIGVSVGCVVCTTFFLAHFRPFSEAAAVQPEVGDNAERASHICREVKHVDLGHGVSLKEVVVFESDGSEERSRYSTITRNGGRVMMIVWNKTGRNATGQSLTRGYWQGGKLVMSEGDEDGDGSDLLILYDDAQMPIQAFEEKKNGTLVPVSRDRITKMKEEFRFMRDIMTPISEGAKRGVDEDEQRKIINDAVSKARKGMDDGGNHSGSAGP